MCVTLLAWLLVYLMLVFDVIVAYMILNKFCIGVMQSIVYVYVRVIKRAVAKMKA